MADIERVLIPHGHIHGSPLHQEMLALPRPTRDKEIIARGWELHYAEAARYPVGSVIRCECGALIQFRSGDYGEYWAKLSWLRRWWMRKGLKAAGLIE